ncbi:TPA: YgjV family protein [Klebsiella quasipneumoniae]|uniref:YgjV family protein n=1 Tax=Klebsiella quasipneumoniae TaxID=1463165 RepID=UPI0012E0F422|nr:YgjV family protein [Klebsiella quasipneumoniae]HBW1503787.1 YgjV family protein [Klebsiella quasipneumoniae subsp. similipneumoniae]MCZ9524077.1 YgjV family protein [Klebsiella quasipneumoniae]URI25077.1 YgjV family protein [Klebsiella quasipneumoniae]HBW1519247.1 YgjV family protein [Klebsiella quasipneumoniae subsp. similipneumoniae]HBW1528523.1 YgjV family protein [Klebsiella quasipneumoniae subsp. similipneumoniae]
MTAYWLAQGVGVITFLIGITTFINRDERRFRLQLAVYSAVIGVHFFLMGAAPAGMSAGLNALRTVISLRTRSLWVMTVFILLTLILGLGKLQYAMELLPIIGTVASTWALFRCKGLTVRCVMWCSTACWVTHNLWLGSIGGTLIEGSFLIVNGLNIIRFRRMQKRGIDPFRVENAVQEESPSAR